MSLKEDKSRLRKEILKRREHLNIQEKKSFDTSIHEQLLEILAQKKIKTIHTFLPMKGEINIYPFITHCLSEGIQVICPKTLPKGQLENRVLKDLKELETGIMKTRHPREKDLYSRPFDLILVPGLAYDRSKNRLGYGGGYYDRFLIKNADALFVAPAYDFQIFDSIPTEEFDQKVDLIISPQK